MIIKDVRVSRGDHSVMTPACRDETRLLAGRRPVCHPDAVSGRLAPGGLFQRRDKRRTDNCHSRVAHDCTGDDAITVVCSRSFADRPAMWPAIVPPPFMVMRMLFWVTMSTSRLIPLANPVFDAVKL